MLARRDRKGEQMNVDPPKSVVPISDGLIGVLGAMLALLAIIGFRLPPLLGAALMVLCAGVPMVLIERARQHASHHPSKKDRALFLSLKILFLIRYPISLVTAVSIILTTNHFLLQLVTAMIALEVTLAINGYLFGFERIVPTLRSMQSRWAGWISCLICYAPFILLIPPAKAIMNNEGLWPVREPPIILVVVLLGATLLSLTATICFGLRFANLANRGVVTTGPFRWMKHPQYTFHVISFWSAALFFMPFSWVTVAALIFLTTAYRLRAITEELHMSESPEYVQYAAWIEEHGLLAKVRSLGRFYRPLKS